MTDDFRLSIEIGNDAMSAPADVARALRQVADDVETGETAGIIRDLNGNTVGTWDAAPAAYYVRASGIRSS